LASPQLNGIDPDMYDTHDPHSRDLHSRDVSLDNNSLEKGEEYSSSVNERDQSPDEPKHSETQHDDGISNSSPQSSPRVPSTAESLRKQLAWATTELALAQAKGYTPTSPDSDDDITDILAKNDIQDKDTRLLQALLSTRHQLSRVKELVKDQTLTASERIAEMERQRDEALSDAAYARARLAAAQSGDVGEVQTDRAAELGRKLVTALSMQNELSMKVDDLSAQLSSERKARKIAEDTARGHLNKFDDAEARRKEHWVQLEEWKGKFTETQKTATDEKVRALDHSATADNLRIENDELKKQVAELTELVENQTSAVKATKAAITSAAERADSAEKQLSGERSQKVELEKEIVQLRQELGTVESLQSKIQELEMQLAQAKEEADAARNVMINGLDTLVSRSTPTTPTIDHDARIRSLQSHLEATKSLHAETRDAAETAAEELSKANERIAALEAAQSQSVREAAALQTRLSESLDQLNALQEEHSKVRSRMTEVQRDLDASYVKQSAIKQLFSERPSSASQLRSLTTTPDVSSRLRDLERQLDESQRLREELETSQEQVMQNLSVASKRHKDATRRQREAEDRVKKLEEELERTSNLSASGSSAVDVAEATKRQLDAEKKLADSTIVFQDRLAQLEADYQSAVHYVKGTEKMIRRMKEELTKYKSQNAFLQTELHELKRQSLKGSDEEVQGWASEKERLVKEIEALQLAQRAAETSAAEQMKVLQSKLDQHAEERDVLKFQLADIQKEHSAALERSMEVEAELERLSQNNGDRTRLENDLAMAKAASKRLEQENQQLETRALEAEEKVSLLLDQVENSVDTYRRSMVTKRTDGNSPPISPRSSSVGNRTSVALDSLAHELDQLRSHWESSTHRYRLSTASSVGRDSPVNRGLGLMPNFDFEGTRSASPRVNGVHHDDESGSRWRDDETPTARTRQITA
jgi:chromosome segregation ATPase